MGESKRRKKLVAYGQAPVYSESEQMDRRDVAVIVLRKIFEEAQIEYAPVDIKAKLDLVVSTFAIGDRHNSLDREIFDLIERAYKKFKDAKVESQPSTNAAAQPTKS